MILFFLINKGEPYEVRLFLNNSKSFTIFAK